MKKLFTLLAVSLAALSASAQYDKSWTFESWTANAKVTENVTVDGLTLHATASSNPEVKAQKKSIELNGTKVDYTMVLNLKGLASADARFVSFPVDGPCEITVVCYHGTSTDTYKRVLNVSYGSKYDEANLHNIVVPTGGNASATTIRYELDKANTIYMGSGNSGVGLCGVYVKYITPENPEPATAPKTWDFTKALSANDVANIEADATNWSKTEPDPAAEDGYVRYTYLPAFTANDAVNDLYGVVLTANGQEVEMTKGLKFGRPNGKMDSNRFRLDDGKRLSINGQYVGFIIPDLKRNDVVRVRFSTATNEDARDVVLTNATTTDNLVSSDINNPNEITCKVLSDGYVGFRAGTNGLNYYAVTVNETLPSSSGISTVDAGKKADGKIYNLCGMEVKNPSTGIYIKNGKKFIKK